MLSFLLRMGIVFFSLLATGNAVSKDSVSEFHVATLDGKAFLNVYVSMPRKERVSAGTKIPVIVVVPGTKATADLYFNPLAPNFEQDEDGMLGLGSKLLANGIAIVRFDTRGTVSGRRCMHGKTRALNFSEFVTDCWNNPARKTVDFESLRQDIVTVYQLAMTLPDIDEKRMGVLAYSEGLLHVANVTGRALIHPRFIAAIGGPAESPYKAGERQMCAFIPDLLAEHFSKNMTTLNVSEMAAVAQKRNWKGQDVVDLFGAKSEIDANDMILAKEKLVTNFTNNLKVYSDVPRHAVFSETRDGINRVESSAGYMKDFFIEKTAFVEPLSELSGFAGPVEIFYGDNDQRLNVPINVGILEKEKLKNKHIHFNVYPHLGHGLEQENQETIPENVANQIVKKFHWFLSN
ncbi:alpha/beta hydrolase family protein [Undibacterium sp. TJN19]|uniref:alpha/beta hydrolase family protein n=1 Tax=Undibacterium sp. TJN19 TaxID=3413055 RepID=UPI003BF2A5A7